jgi:hypothetical protein
VSRFSKIFPFILGVWLLIVTLLRTFELPDPFVQAHWLIDYRLGFIKRGFIGSIITIFSHLGIIPRSEYIITVLSFVNTIVLYAMFFLILWRIFEKTSWDEYSYSILYILMTSPFVLTSGDFFGNFDPIIIVISFMCVWLIIHEKIIPCSILIIIALLIHENYLVIGFPLLLFTLYTTKNSHGRLRMKMIYPILVVFVTFLMIFIAENIFTDKNQLRVDLAKHLVESGIISEEWAGITAGWITTSMIRYLSVQMYFFFPRIFNAHTTLMILPSVVVMMLFIYERLNMSHRRTIMTYALCATFAPLLLHLVAWDTQRISAYTIVTAFGCLWICAETLPPSKTIGRPSPTSQILIGSALVANCFMQLPLVLGRAEEISTSVRIGLYAPVFLTLLVYYLRWKRLHESSAPPPERDG